MNACDYFLQLITQAHVFAAAMQHLHCSSVTELRTKITDQASMDSLTTAICTQYAEISMDRPSASRTLDRVQEYGKEALALGMLFLEFKDAIREGDGTRVLCCWKYFLLLFHASGHTNYCLEALNLLVQYYYTLSPRLAEQMLWGRFVNSEGKIAHNISCHLHMEHLNREIKGAINHLGANKTPKAILRAGKL